PATAATTSAAWTAIEPGEEPIRWFMYGTIGLQTVVAAVALWGCRPPGGAPIEAGRDRVGRATIAVPSGPWERDGPDRREGSSAMA
ncbi:MAG: hypothetical protein AAGA93_26090, partial [Actinomycetota bacterium]